MNIELVNSYASLKSAALKRLLMVNELIREARAEQDKPKLAYLKGKRAEVSRLLSKVSQHIERKEYSQVHRDHLINQYTNFSIRHTLTNTTEEST